ncbi:hypothetical protein D3OALGB2SA_1225 [Olavius algarvensis associated proteobacterium Delta 3]|nr:hypothetical protein D3OALGB2SA_1225 [Olavius algarvensis associated proteobacterium Delta 3]
MCSSSCQHRFSVDGSKLWHPLPTNMTHVEGSGEHALPGPHGQTRIGRARPGWRIGSAP